MNILPRMWLNPLSRFLRTKKDICLEFLKCTLYYYVILKYTFYSLGDGGLEKNRWNYFLSSLTYSPISLSFLWITPKKDSEHSHSSSFHSVRGIGQFVCAFCWKFWLQLTLYKKSGVQVVLFKFWKFHADQNGKQNCVLIKR